MFFKTGQSTAVKGKLIALSLLLAWIWATSAQAQVITNLSQFHQLPQQAATQALSVKVQGQILYCDPGWQQFFMISPEGETLFLSLADKSLQTNNPGDTVEITAKSRWSPRRQAPALTNIQVRITGHQPLPDPEKLTVPQLFSQQWLHKRVRVDGVIVKKEDVSDRLRLEVQLNPTSSAEVIVRNRDALGEKALLSSAVSITGVNISSASNEPTAAEIKLYTSSLKDITIIKPGDTNLFTVPLISIAELNAWANQPGWTSKQLQRQHFKGRVIQSIGGNWFRVSDETGTLLLHTRKRGFSYGSELDCSGFPRLTDNQAVAMYECDFLSGDIFDPSLETLPVLTNTLSVRMLTSIEAQRGYPVKLRGVVTFYDPEWHMCFIADASGGVYLNAQGPALDLKTGNLVEVTGFTDPGAYIPMVSNVKITKTGDGVIPPPKKTSADALMNGREDAQWLQLEGVIREANIYEQHTQLKITGQTGPILAWVPSIPPSNWFNRLVDSRVVCLGACGTDADKYRRLTGVTFFIPSWESNFFRFVRTAPDDPFTAPTQLIKTLQNYSARDAFEYRAKVSGVVTICTPEGLIFFQDSSAGMRVRHKDARPQPGEIIEVIGFPTPETPVPQLEQPIIRTIGKTNLPIAIPAKASDLLEGRKEYIRIRLTGKLLNLLPSTNITRLVLHDGDTIFYAVVQTDDPSSVCPVLGSIIQVDGVGRVPPYTETRSALLFVKDPQDIKVLEYPPWWDAQKFFYALILLAIITLAMLIPLRKRVSHSIIGTLFSFFKPSINHSNTGHNPTGKSDGIVLSGSKILAGLQAGEKCPQCHVRLGKGILAHVCPNCLLKNVINPSTLPEQTFSSHSSFENNDNLSSRYKLVEKLGRGGMGVVWKARQLGLNRMVALKFLHVSKRKNTNPTPRFMIEIRALAQLSHSNIVAIHEYGKTGSAMYFAMEYVDGANLRTIINSQKLSQQEVLFITDQICNALQYAHTRGVIHRDIKPENILIDDKFNVKIADFGLAKINGDELRNPTLTVSGQILGTAHYIAPEQVESPHHVDHRVDIFALGVVIYEMLTGELPLGYFMVPSQKNPELAAFDNVILKTLSKNREHRYQRADEIQNDLRRISETLIAPNSPACPPVNRN